MIYLLPYRKEKEIEDGAIIKAMDFCKRHCNTGKCQKFYMNLPTRELNEFITCPYGMSVYISDEGGKRKIFSSIREKTSYNRQKAANLPHNKETIYNPLLDEKILRNMVMITLQNEEDQRIVNEKRASIDSISHEAKKLNAQIRDRSDIILQEYGNEAKKELMEEELLNLVDKVKTIYICSSMVDARYSLLNYEKNPQVLSSGAIIDCNVYKKFDKIRRVFSNYLGRKIAVNILGSSYKYIKAYPSFDMIPLLLVENAIKYSYAGNPVEIIFLIDESRLIVDISSYSPYCSKEELDHIFEKGFRGKNAKRAADGSGIGLFFVKMLCDLHKIDIIITSDSRKMTNIDGITYAPYNVRLVFSEIYDI